MCKVIARYLHMRRKGQYCQHHVHRNAVQKCMSSWLLVRKFLDGMRTGCPRSRMRRDIGCPLRAARSTPSSGGLSAGATHAPSLAQSVEILLYLLCARLILQELPLLLELELSELFLAAQWVRFPFDVVQLQLMLQSLALLLKLELVQLPLHLVQLLLASRCCETGATGCLVPQLVELPLRMMECLGALEMLQVFALVEFVDLFLLGCWRPLFSELAGRRPAGGRSQKQSGQHKTCSKGSEQFHQRTSFAL
jgi:hypothetical protein